MKELSRDKHRHNGQRAQTNAEQQTQKSKKENAKHFRLSKPGLIVIDSGIRTLLPPPVADHRILHLPSLGYP